MGKIDIRTLNIDEITKIVIEIGESKFRGKQIYEWLNNKLVNSFDEMTNLSKELRIKLGEVCEMSKIEIFEKHESEIDGTIKYLFKLGEHTIIESVFMKHDYGNTVCVSTQAGCKQGCSFCASTIDGLDRNLTAGEILAQIYEIQKDVGERIKNIVVMGSGEPLENFDNLIKFLELINSKEGLNISHRNITVSTCGLIEKIIELRDLKLQINLAVSLHSGNDGIRSKLMPVNIKNPLEDLLEVCKNYSNTTKRRVTYEYALIKGVNDSEKSANELGKKIKGTMCHVNLIPINIVEERDYEKSSKGTINDFCNILRSLGIDTTIRRSLGSDVNGACGQLRKQKL